MLGNDAGATVGALLAGGDLNRVEARALLAHVLGCTRERLIAHPEQAVDTVARAQFFDLAARHAAGEPLAYLLGRQEFYGREFDVNRAVLIPRPETELLVERVLAELRGVAQPRVLDLGTGSGCIAISLALERPDAAVTAVDASSEALAVARGNADRLGATVEWIDSDWFGSVAGPFDAIVSNPPYVAAGDPHLAALHDEPRSALLSGADGLNALRLIVGAARGHLKPGGLLAVEHGYDQGAAVRALFAAAGFSAIATYRDAAGLERVCLGRS